MSGAARCAASWTLYALGKCVSRVIQWRELGLCPFHDRLMEWSWDVQGPRERGPWAAVRETFLDE